MSFKVYVEGGDCSFKSLSTQKLKVLLESLYSVQCEIGHATLTNLCEELYRAISKIKRTQLLPHEVESHLYKGIAMADIPLFEQEESGIWRIQDSLILPRSIGYFAGENQNEIVDELINLLAQYPDPEHAVYLHTDMDVRKSRLVHRMQNKTKENISPGNLLILEDEAKFNQIESALREATVGRFGSTVIDTSNLSPEEVAAEIVRTMG